METTLEITEDNIEDAEHLIKRECVVGEELTCFVDFEVTPADPEVGLSADVQITDVTSNGYNVMPLFDENELYKEVLEYENAQQERERFDAADRAFEAMRERQLDCRFQPF